MHVRKVTDESSTNQGKVEICVDETWGTISSTTWAHLEALTIIYNETSHDMHRVKLVYTDLATTANITVRNYIYHLLNS